MVDKHLLETEFWRLKLKQDKDIEVFNADNICLSGFPTVNDKHLLQEDKVCF